MVSHRLMNQPADSSRRRIGYSVPDASVLRFCTSAPDSSSVGLSRNASNTRNVWRDIRTSRLGLPIVVSLHRGLWQIKRLDVALQIGVADAHFWPRTGIPTTCDKRVLDAACATPAFDPLRSVTGDRFLAAATRLRHTDTHGRRFTYCRSNTRTSCCVSKNAKVCAFLIVMTIPSSDTTAV
jgi:hypothetical protein